MVYSTRERLLILDSSIISCGSVTTGRDDNDWGDDRLRSHQLSCHCDRSPYTLCIHYTGAAAYNTGVTAPPQRLLLRRQMCQPLSFPRGDIAVGRLRAGRAVDG